MEAKATLLHSSEAERDRLREQFTQTMTMADASRATTADCRDAQRQPRVDMPVCVCVRGLDVSRLSAIQGAANNDTTLILHMTRNPLEDAHIEHKMQLRRALLVWIALTPGALLTAGWHCRRMNS
jgi:hypothetical protein